MWILKYFINSLDSLWRNKLRSALSTLWIVIWIASVSIMMALWEWLKEQMLQSLSVSNDVIKISQKNNYWWGWGEWDDKKWKPEEKAYIQVKEVFNEQTVENIKKYISNVKYIVWYWNWSWWDSFFEWKNIYASLFWVTQDYFKAKWLKISAWSWFEKKHFDKSSKVVILWSEFVKYDLEWKNPVWKKMMIWWYSYDVLWVLEKSNDWQSNYAIIIPFPTARDSAWVKKFEEILVYVNDIQKIEPTKKDLLYLLLKLSWVSTPTDVLFWIVSNDEAIKEINKTINQVKLFLWWIAWISLLVWWIWIMNIMLVSVVERTREIWIRKAIWARKRDILTQFLVESIVISILWAIIAFLITILWVYLINKYAPWDFKAVINLNVVMFASWVSVLMWIVFWLLPAWKASKMKPIDALRFE